VKDHREVAGSDDETAEKDGQTRAEQVVGGESARQGGYIDGHRVPTVDRGGALYVEAQTALRRGRNHIKDKDGAHAVVAEALPKLGEEKRAEAFRVSDEGRVAQFWVEFSLCGHNCAAIYPAKVQRSKKFSA